MKEPTIFAVYEGDTFAFMGTRGECAKELGVKPETISFMASPAHHRRIKSTGKIIIRVEDIEEDNYAMA